MLIFISSQVMLRLLVQDHTLGTTGAFQRRGQDDLLCGEVQNRDQQMAVSVGLWLAGSGLGW